MKVFVSSTYEDLKAHRDAVRNALLRLRHQPVMMEDFGSQPRAATPASLRELDACDAFVGIYAYRYGHRSDAGASITELEYDRAHEKRIPCFLYLVDPVHPWPTGWKDLGADGEAMIRFKERVSRLVRSRFGAPEDLAFKVAADLGRELGGREGTLPYGIRPSRADFTGRKEELRQLVDALRPKGTFAIQGIVGMGGVGKTELALKAAEEVAEDYPDGTLMVDLRGSKANPLSPAEAMGQVIATLRPASRLGDLPAGRIAELYQGMLRGKRLLLVLDDALDETQVTPLLPPPGCGVISTSRNRFTVPGLAEPVELGALRSFEAEALLRTLCSRVGPAAALLAERCGYLPLALRIAGSALAESPDLESRSTSPNSATRPSASRYCGSARAIRNEMLRLASNSAISASLLRAGSGGNRWPSSRQPSTGRLPLRYWGSATLKSARS